MIASHHRIGEETTATTSKWRCGYGFGFLCGVHAQNSGKLRLIIIGVCKNVLQGLKRLFGPMNVSRYTSTSSALGLYLPNFLPGYT